MDGPLNEENTPSENNATGFLLFNIFTIIITITYWICIKVESLVNCYLFSSITENNILLFNVSGRILTDVPCRVCHDHSSGKHYGIFACDG